jgi:hypothetical protein
VKYNTTVSTAPSSATHSTIIAIMH